MKSPHPNGHAHYHDSQSYRTIPPEEELLIEQGYKFMGWQNDWSLGSPVEVRRCLDQAHNYYSAFPNVFKSVQHTPSGSDVTQSCTKCKIYWKVDMSD